MCLVLCLPLNLGRGYPEPSEPEVQYAESVLG